MSRPVPVVAHTHWDREWYAPFEAFQARLAGVLDNVLETLESDPAWPAFLLDGQTAILDDYLALRPDAVPKIEKLVGDGRLNVGPWYVLMDEFCVSGETIIRNLQLGLHKAAGLGQERSAGYLPDMFGHTAQMPQILTLAGITNAVVWRGVPSAIRRTAFWWRSPDGSRVRAEYLPVGYANGAFLPDEAGALLRRIAAHETELGEFLPDPSAPLLLMNGTDHQDIQPYVPAVLAEANDSQDRYRFELTSLAEYLESAPTDDLPCWSGELRSGARAPLLAGTVSNRTDIKAAAASAETALERLAEPMAVLWLPPDLWPQQSLDRAWLETIRNSAHDSICACSSDQVTRAVLHRYDTASALAAVVIEDAASIAGVATTTRGPVVLNPSAHPRTGAVEFVIPADIPADGAQVLPRDEPHGAGVREGAGADLGTILADLTARRWLGDAGKCTEATVTTGDGAVRLSLVYDPSRRPEPATAAVLAEAWALAGANPDRPLTVTVNRPPTRAVVAISGDVPGFGWAAWEPGPLPFEAARAGENWIDNGIIRASVDPISGTFSINDVTGRDLTGLDLLVDGGDAGDSYNYCPPDTDSVVDSPESVDVQVVEPGPVRARIRVIRRFRWQSAVPVDVTTVLTLIAGERAVRVETTFDNPCRDHRLRAVFPLPSPTDHTTAGCAFASVTRKKAEGGPREPALSTYPARGFVSAGGLTVLHEGVREYELINDGTALAVTILRATGILSRPWTPARPNIAGPPIAVEDAQMLGPVRARYAVVVGEVDPWKLGEDLWTPMSVVAGTGTGHLPPTGSRLQLNGANVSALRRSGGRIEIRVFNPSEQPTEVTVPGHRGVVVDLRGKEQSAWDGRFDLQPWEIKTVLLDAISLDA